MSMRTGNLSTRPFYNERLVSAILGVLLIGVMIAAAVGIGHAISLSSQYEALTSRAQRNDSEAKAFKKALSVVQNEASTKEIDFIAKATRDEKKVLLRTYIGL